MNAEGNVVTGDEKKADALNAFFVLNIRASCPQDIHLPEVEVGDGEISKTPTIHEEMMTCRREYR